MKLHLRLTVDVVYEAWPQDVSWLKSSLTRLTHRAADNGLMTGDSSATVDTWSAKVIEIKKKKRATKKTHPK